MFHTEVDPLLNILITISDWIPLMSHISIARSCFTTNSLCPPIFCTADLTHSSGPIKANYISHWEVLRHLDHVGSDEFGREGACELGKEVTAAILWAPGGKERGETGETTKAGGKYR